MRFTGRYNIIAAFVVMLALMASPGMCQFLVQHDVAKSDLVEKIQSAEVDWGNECYYATGEAIMPTIAEEPNRSRAQLKAKGSAKTKAVASLMMAIENTPINNRAIGKDCISKDFQLQQSIQYFMANAEVVEEKLRSEGGDTIVSVTVKLPMYGKWCVGSAILYSRIQRKADGEQPRANVIVEKRSDFKAFSVPQDAKGPFSSLIIDCTGLNLQHAMNPRIRNLAGSRIWGSLTSDCYLLIDQGIVSYVQSIEEAKQSSKAGCNPLMMRAAGRAGSRFMCDVVLSDQDADLLIKENQSSKFMNKASVILVVDGK